MFESPVPDELAGERADRAVSVLAGISRSLARALIEAGQATIDGGAVAPAKRVEVGGRIRVQLPDPAPGLIPEKVEFEVRFEDESVAVVDKPADVVTHPGAGNFEGTLAAGILYRWPEVVGVGEADRWGIVHRLDRETSGLLAVAKTSEALAGLRRQLADRRLEREYLALAHGRFDITRGTIDAAIGRDDRYPTRFAVKSEGREARTHYRRRSSWASPGVSLLEVSLETGRTHQIRVHLASIGHPLVGDVVYGGRGPEPADPGRVWLHAARLSFQHPLTHEPVTVTSPLPTDLEESLERLGPPD